MSAIQIQTSISGFSSENKKYLASNLLKEDKDKSWKCDQWKEYSWIVLEISQPSQIELVEISNSYSAFVEVFVSNSPNSNFRVLVPVFSCMSPSESRNKTNCKEKFTFKSKHFSPTASPQSWKYIKFVCSQPFNKSIRYGLSSVRICGHKREETNTVKSQQQSLFGKFKLKVVQSEFNKGDIFAAYDLKYKKGLIEKYEEKPKLPSLIPCKEGEKENDQQEEQSAKKPRKDNKKREHTDDDGDGGGSNRKKHKPIKEDGASVPGGTSSSGQGGGSSAAAAAASSTLPLALQQPSTSRAQFSSPTVPQKKSDSGQKRKAEKSAKPYDKLMSHVVFVLSGFQNPLRSELRDKAMAMGARYSTKWDSNCTHLICAFPNTPKYDEVKRLNGRIVSKKWILECSAQRKLLEWRNFMIGTYNGPDTPNNSDHEDEDHQPKLRKDTDDDDANDGHSVAANDKRAAKRSTNTATNGYDSDVIYDMDTESDND